MIEISSKSWDDAIKTLEEATQADNYLLEAIIKLAEIECNVYKNPQRALARISHAIKIDPGFAELYVVLADIYEAMGDTEGALEASFKGLTLSEKTPILSISVIPKIIL